MPTLKKINFIASDEGLEVARTLQLMTSDRAYNTSPSFSANTAMHPDNLISFTERHLNYLNVHPNTDPRQYIANLRLMTRIR